MAAALALQLLEAMRIAVGVAILAAGRVASADPGVAAGATTTSATPSVQAPPAPRQSVLAGSLSLGIESTSIIGLDSSYDSPGGYGPRIDGELGPATSGWRGVVSWNRFRYGYTDDEQDAHAQRYDLIRIGARHLTQLGGRVTIGFGGGVMIVSSHDSIGSDSGVGKTAYADVRLAVDLVRIGPLALCASTTVDVFFPGASWTAGLGVGVR